MTTMCTPHPVAFRILLPVLALAAWAALTLLCNAEQPAAARSAKPRSTTAWTITDTNPGWAITDTATATAPPPAVASHRAAGRRPLFRRTVGRCLSGRCG